MGDHIKAVAINFSSEGGGNGIEPVQLLPVVEMAGTHLNFLTVCPSSVTRKVDGR